MYTYCAYPIGSTFVYLERVLIGISWNFNLNFLKYEKVKIENLLNGFFYKLFLKSL